MDEKEKFIARLYPAAVKISEETGMSWQLILAQAAQETGWGKKVLPGTNNIFNIKAGVGWEGETKTFNVWERVQGRTVWIDQPFRVYETLEDAMADRVRFLRENPRYTKAGLFDEGTIGDLAREADALQRAGYATDENYARSLVEVFEGRTMRRAIALAGHEVDQVGTSVSQRDASTKELQTSLNRLGYVDAAGCELKVDGDYGRRTRLAVEDFQRRHGLVADGIAGPLTLAAVDRAVKTELRSIGQPDAPYLRSGHPSDNAMGAPASFSSSETRALDWQDPRHPRSALHDLYIELGRRVPDASEDRLLQFTAVCHESCITAENLVEARLDEQQGTLTFVGTGALAQPAHIDLKSPPPYPDEAIQQIQQHDLQQQQVMEQVRAQQAEMGMSHSR